MTKIRKAYPPNYAEIKARFNPRPGTVFAYGDTIYAPHSNGALPADLVAHERVHFTQQAAVGGPEAWWRRYIDEPEFRLAQEVEAYRVQYNDFMRNLPRPRRRELLSFICKSLSSPMYGSLVTRDQARQLIAGAAA